MQAAHQKGKSRLNVVVLGLLAGVLLNVFAALSLWQGWQVANDRVAQRTTNMAQAYADFTFRALDSYDQILQDVQGLVESKMPYGDVQRYLQRQKTQHPYLLNLFAFDAEGRIAAGTQDQMADLSQRDYVTVHRQDDAAGRYMGHPATSRITPGRWFFPLSRRIPAYGDPFVGVAAATIDITDLTSAFERLRDGPEIAIALVHTDGTLLTRVPMVTEMLGKNMNIQGLQGERYRTFTARSPFDGTDRIVTQRQVPHYPLYVFASLPQRQAWDEWVRQAVPVIFATGCLSLAILAMTLHLQRQTHQREGLLSDLARAKDQAEHALRSLARTQTAMVRREKLAALGGLVAGIAHEVNTPVGNALTSASFLDKENQSLRDAYGNQTLSAEDLEAYLATSGEAIRLILSNCQRAAELIHGFKQVAVDQTSGERREFELAEYVDEILLSLRPKLKHSKVKVVTDIPRGIMVNSYPGALSQVVTNLVMNSLMHGYDDGQSGTIHLQAAIKDHSQVELHYQDDGKGIPSALIDRVFDPFFTTRRGSGGSGLGMNIVHNLVHRTLQGSIHLESDEGKGVQFRISFPLIAPVMDSTATVEGTVP